MLTLDMPVLLFFFYYYFYSCCYFKNEPNAINKDAISVASETSDHPSK